MNLNKVGLTSVPEPRARPVREECDVRSLGMSMALGRDGVELDRLKLAGSAAFASPFLAEDVGISWRLARRRPRWGGRSSPAEVCSGLAGLCRCELALAPDACWRSTASKYPFVHSTQGSIPRSRMSGVSPVESEVDDEP